MNVYLDLFTLFTLFCIVQGLTTASWLFFRPRRPANRWLAWLMLGLTLQVVDYFLSRSGVYFRHLWLYFMPLFFSWSFGPLFYNYVQTSLGNTKLVSKLWFIPVGIQALFYSLLMAQSLATKTWFWQTVHKPYTRFIEYYIACGLLLFFLYRSRLAIRQAGQTGSGLGGLVNGLTVFYVIAVIEPVINPTYLAPGAPRFYLTANVLPILVYALALIGLFYEGMLRERFGVPPKPQQPVIISADQQEQVRRAMQVDHLYRDPDLTLTSLAQQLSMAPNTLSRIINAGFNQSFADFINTYRVQDVKHRLAAGEADRVTILALGLDAGFSSKTTFNRVFKELTGFTPKDYQKRSQITLRDDNEVV